MPSSASHFRSRLLEFAWNCWAEMGVSGWPRQSVDLVVDPESLLLLTGCLGDADPRLRDESLDWCHQHSYLLSRARLRSLLKGWPGTSCWPTYAGTLQELTGQSWPQAEEGRFYEPTKRSNLKLSGRPSLIGLRIRAALGVSARSEILRFLMLASAQKSFSVADLAREAAYSKRNVAETLDGLVASGQVVGFPDRNLVRYRLENPLAWKRLFAPAPKAGASGTPFASLCRAASRLNSELEGIESAQSGARSVEARRLLCALATDVGPDPTPAIPSPNHGEDAWPLLVKWAEDLLRSA